MPIKHAGDCLQHSRVADSRYRSGRDIYVYRQRECLKCGRKWSTNEISTAELTATQPDDWRKIMHQHFRTAGGAA